MTRARRKIMNRSWVRRERGPARRRAKAWWRKDSGITNAVSIFVANNDFSNAAWIKTLVTVATDVTTDPDSGSAADRIDEDATAGNHIVGQNPTPTYYAPGKTTLSVSAKYINRQWVWLSNASGSACWFDIQNGIVGTQTNCTGKIVDQGDGWYRCTMVYLAAGSATNQIGTADADNTTSTAGSGSVYLYNGWFEQRRVSAWADRLRNVPPMLQATGSDQPGYDLNGNIIQDNLDDWISSTFSIAYPNTVFLVGVPTLSADYTTGPYFMDSRLGLRMAIRAIGPTTMRFHTDGANIIDVSLTPSLNTLVITECQRNLANSYGRVGGVQNTGTFNNPGDPTGLTLGAFGSGTQPPGSADYSDSRHDELVFYERVLTETEKAAQRKELNLRYNLPA